MKYQFRITIASYYRFENGSYSVIGEPDSLIPSLISSDFVATIRVGDIISRPFSIFGEEIVAWKLGAPNYGMTVIRTNDNLDDIVPYLGKLPIIIEGYLPTVQ